MSTTAQASAPALCLTGGRGGEENEATSVDTSILPAAQQGRLASRGPLRLVGEDTGSQRWIWSWKVSACDMSMVTGGKSPVLGLRVSRRASLVESDEHQGCLSEVTPQVARHLKPPLFLSLPIHTLEERLPAMSGPSGAE